MASLRKIADFDVVPGDLVRPRKNWNVTSWYDAVRDDSGAVKRMSSATKMKLKTLATVITVDENPEALLLYCPDMPQLVWVWRNSIVLVKI